MDLLSQLQKTPDGDVPIHFWSFIIFSTVNCDLTEKEIITKQKEKNILITKSFWNIKSITSESNYLIFLTEG